MLINPDYAPGATPLDADELASLIPSHITTQGDLNEWEQLNIVQGNTWARKQRKEILDEGFLRRLHQQMFGETWRWAGSFRKSDKNIGVDWLQIGVELKKLLDDVRYQVANGSLPPDEIAVRFHHRLVAIRPFPNGNGRHARLMADLLVERLGRPRFTWGSASLTDTNETRQRYIAALQAADARDIAPCLPLPVAELPRQKMKTNLSRDHRRILEATCAQARAAAEAGAERALHALAVGAKEAPGHQSDAQKKLRVRLRAHGRALGDELSQDNTQRIDSPPNESTALGRYVNLYIMQRVFSLADAVHGV